MAYAEAANNGVKRRRGEWQILGTRFAEVQGRVECTRENNHRRRDISANYERAATRFRAPVGQPSAPTPQSWLRIPGGDQQPAHLRPKRRLHTSEPRPGSAAARYHAAWKAHKGSLRQ